MYICVNELRLYSCQFEYEFECLCRLSHPTHAERIERNFAYFINRVIESEASSCFCIIHFPKDQSHSCPYFVPTEKMGSAHLPEKILTHSISLRSPIYLAIRYKPDL